MRGTTKSTRAITTMLGIALLLAIFSLAVTWSLGVRVGAHDPAGVDAYVRSQMSAGNVPGLGLAVVRGGRVVEVKGFGTADAHGSPVTPQTPFVIASLTKAFTAVAVMQLVERGLVDLDAPAQRYIPWFHLADATDSARITVRDLLYQTSGIPSSTGAQICGLATPDAAVRFLAGVEPSSPPGRSFRYTDANYVTLGVLIERVSALSYQAYVKEHILTPLAMTHTYLSTREASGDGLAQGHRTLFGIPIPAGRIGSPACLAAGFIVSSAEDMGHWLTAQLNGGRYEQSSLLSPSGISEMHLPGWTSNREPHTATGYAMGWFTGTADGGPIIWHDGDDSFYHADALIAPGQAVGVVVLMNAGAGGLWYDGIRGNLAFGVLGRALGRGQDSEPGPAPAVSPVLVVVLGLVAVLLAQVGLVMRTIAGLDGRLRPRPTGRTRVLRPLVRSAVPGLVWAALLLGLLLGIGALHGVALLTVLGRWPELAYLAIASAVVAVLWGVVSTGLDLLLRRPQAE